MELLVSEPCASVIKQMSDFRISLLMYELLASKRWMSVAKSAWAFQVVIETSPANWPR